MKLLIVTKNNGLPYVEVCISSISIHNHNFQSNSICPLSKSEFLSFHFVRFRFRQSDGVGKGAWKRL